MTLIFLHHWARQSRDFEALPSPKIAICSSPFDGRVEGLVVVRGGPHVMIRDPMFHDRILWNWVLDANGGYRDSEDYVLAIGDFDWVFDVEAYGGVGPSVDVAVTGLCSVDANVQKWFDPKIRGFLGNCLTTNLTFFRAGVLSKIAGYLDQLPGPATVRMITVCNLLGLVVGEIPGGRSLL